MIVAMPHDKGWYVVPSFLCLLPGDRNDSNRVVGVMHPSSVVIGVIGIGDTQVLTIERVVL